jgi:urease accessory protein
MTTTTDTAIAGASNSVPVDTPENMPAPIQLISLLHLASPALPIGSFSYSQGLEAAIDCGLVTDEHSAETWIRDNLLEVQAHAEAPLWLLLHRCWTSADLAGVKAWNEWFHVSRETAELRMETEQMGWSLAKLITQMQWGNDFLRSGLDAIYPVCLPTAFAAACVALGVDAGDGLAAYCFSWAENQVAAAIKGVPLGQAAGQRILYRLHPVVRETTLKAMHRANMERPILSTFSPMLGILSARHETQYSRLFRS